MMMTKKHFTLIAQTLAACKPEYYDMGTMARAFSDARLETWANSVREFAHRLSLENPKFDCAKFYQACNYEVTR